jgi:hypothetical protein
MSKASSLENSGLSPKELKILKKLNTPAKIQDFLNKLSFDFAPGDEIDRSVIGTLRSGKTDCAGGAILATAALWVNGYKPLLLDLKATQKDIDHVVTLFGDGKHWGAISKTNHAVLRYREPVYENVRELVMSYFHEYFLPNGEKTLLSYSAPFDLSKYGTDWFTNSERILDIIYDLDISKHFSVVTSAQRKKFRKADPIEIKAGEITEYKQ